MVGKIVNHNVKKFNRALEKGYFLFGGSTIVMLFKEGMIEIDEDILSNSEKGIETKVKALETIGRRSGK
jgi:phosphatidylserine decarboxylase